MGCGDNIPFAFARHHYLFLNRILNHLNQQITVHIVFFYLNINLYIQFCTYVNDSAWFISLNKRNVLGKSGKKWHVEIVNIYRG